MRDPLPANRRGFLVAVIEGLLVLTGVGLVIPALRYLLALPKSVRPDQWIDAGDLSDVDVGAPRVVTFRRNRVDGWKVFSEKASAWVVKRNGGGVTAFSPLCTHLGCAYRWEDARHEFMCPCHGSWFDIDGKVLAGPASRPLDQYEVKVDGDQLWLGPLKGPEAKS